MGINLAIARRWRDDFAARGADEAAELLDRAATLVGFLREGAELQLPAGGQAQRLAAMRGAARRRSVLGALDAVRTAFAANAPDRAPVLDYLLFLGACPFDALATIPAAALPLTDPAFANAEAPPPCDEPPTGFGNLVLIMKLTRLCNLRCTYCNDWREGSGNTMTAATQAQLMRRVAEDASVSSICFVWHGGEPSLFGVRQMLGFLWLQARLRRPGQILTNSIQTNAVALPDKVLALWRLFDFKVSVSLDGPRSIHDLQRLTKAGKGSFDEVSRGIARLRTAGVFVGGLIVVTAEIAAYPIERLVADLLAAGVSTAGFLPVRPESSKGAGSYLPPEAFADFMVRLFDLLRCRPDLKLDVRELNVLHAAWAGQPTRFCEFNGPCLGGYFGVEPDGTVQHCDKFLGSKAHTIGHIDAQGFGEMRASPAMTALREVEAQRWLRLCSCRWYGCCKGWCPHESHVAHLTGTASTCCGLASVFEHFEAVAGVKGTRA
ncbi:MAG: radical SAM protein [Polyangiaceae bacterium]|nr:radical SAM protein [Polyangiaceae bacterium]